MKIRFGPSETDDAIDKIKSDISRHYGHCIQDKKGKELPSDKLSTKALNARVRSTIERNCRIYIRIESNPFILQKHKNKQFQKLLRKLPIEEIQKGRRKATTDQLIKEIETITRRPPFVQRMKRLISNTYSSLIGQDTKTAWDDHELPLLKTLASRITSELESDDEERTTRVNNHSASEGTFAIGHTSLTKQSTPISATSLQTQTPGKGIPNPQTEKTGILKKATKYHPDQKDKYVPKKPSYR